MALLYTPQPDIGRPLPHFQLNDVNGQPWSSESINAAPAKVIVFMCNHCPYVKAIEDRLIQLAHDLAKKDVPFIAICSNDANEYPEDSPTELLRRSKEKEYPFTYLVDTDQIVARTFGAVCTPDFFVYDKNNCLAYRGRLDDSWKDATKVIREELKEAVYKILEGKGLGDQQIPSMGCSIKWKE